MASKWIHCPNCGHRLFLLLDGQFKIEIKCPSCKQILPVDQDTKGGKHHGKQTSLDHLHEGMG